MDTIVSKAIQLYEALKKRVKNDNKTELLLIHSHFRIPDREQIMKKLIEHRENRIIVSTQVIEAGIDISSDVMFTEIAPISSLIQRIGRCNRRGEIERAEVYLIVPREMDEYKSEPYEKSDIIASNNKIMKIINEDIKSNFNINSELNNFIDEYYYNFVLRKSDIIQLFSTEQGLTGEDVDISRFVRSGSDINAFVFWRNIDITNVSRESLPDKEELCPAPVSDINSIRKKEAVYRYDWLTGKWNKLNSYNTGDVIPGNIYMLDSHSGHYSSEQGWNIKSSSHVEPVGKKAADIDKGYESNSSSISNQWKSIMQHSDEVRQKVTQIMKDLCIQADIKNEIIEAAIWHDAGKAHPIFQSNINQINAPQQIKNCVAKAPNNEWNKRPDRKYFRHELASGILALDYGKSDLVAYLATSHHGKVRTSIRSIPDEKKPADPKKTRYARGVWDGDKISTFDLSANLQIQCPSIDISYMELGITNKGNSWEYRVSKLIDDYGIFKLAYMENVLRSGDQRASGGLP